MRYDFPKRRVTQQIGSISFYDIEGDFDSAIKSLERSKQYYEANFQNYAAEVHDGGLYDGYADGVKRKFVKFDSFSLIVEDEPYENGSKHIVVYGERDILPEELAALQEKEDKNKARRVEDERAQYERLAKKFGKLDK